MAKVSINFDRDFSDDEKLQVAKIATELMKEMQDKLRKTKLSDHKRVVAHYQILKMSVQAIEQAMKEAGIERGSNIGNKKHLGLKPEVAVKVPEITAKVALFIAHEVGKLELNKDNELIAFRSVIVELGRAD